MSNPSSILNGIDGIIESHLGLNDIGDWGVRYRSVSACKRLSGSAPPRFRADALVDELLNQIERDWRAAGAVVGGSRQNWRFEKKLDLAANNTSPEKTLEKVIARCAGDDWINQVPTASGLVNGAADKKRSVDLVHRVAVDRFELIELKYGSDTPLFAVLEVLQYGALYLFWRRHLDAAASNSPIAAARGIHLRVLAPAEYYRGYRFDWLERVLTGALQQVSATFDGPAIDLACAAFPESFDWPCSTEDLLASLGQIKPVVWSG